MKHHIINLYGEWRHSSTHFNHCCRYRWAVMLCPLPHGKNPHYLFNKLDWPQGQYRCDSKEISLHHVYDFFCVLWLYMLEVWGAFIPSLKHNYFVTRGCTLFVKQDPNWCQSVQKNVSVLQYHSTFPQNTVWLATAVPLAVQYAAASSSNIHELLLLPAKFEWCF